MTSTFISRSRPLFLATIGCWLLVASLFVGCRDRAKERVSTSSPAAGNASSQDQIASLDATLETLQPTIYELDLPRDMPIRDLNAWALTNLRDMLVPEQTDERLAAALSKYASPEFVKDTMREQFNLQDAIHLRDCLWAAGLGQSVRQKGDSTLQSTVRCFYQVVHELVLIRSEQSVPLEPFNSMMFGRGTAEDRAWSFAMLAAQDRIPVGVFEFENEKLPAVAGAVISGQIYLFDMTNGLPIANPTDIADGKTWIEQPATLADVIANEKFFDLLSTRDFDYPLTTADFKTAKIGLVGDSSTWSRRMEALNNALAGKTDGTVAQNFASYGTGDDRVIGVSEAMETAVEKLLPKDSVTIWPYPETQRNARENHSAAQTLILDAWRLPLTVPREVQGWVPLKIGPAQYKQQAARARQISGNPKAAFPIYLAVQRWDDLPPLAKDVESIPQRNIAMAQQQLPPAIVLMHKQAAEQAFFWRATAQLQTASYKPASVTFDSYLRQYAGRSEKKTYIDYLSEASYLGALAEARITLEEVGSPEELEAHQSRAFSLMERVEKGSRFGAAQLMLARWDALQAAKKAAAEPKTDETKPPAEAKVDSKQE